MNKMRKRTAHKWTTPDLVLLSLLAERAMHGYQANLELERREIRDWAGISRPQVYYSLEKLARAGLIRTLETDAPAAGPERNSYQTTARGRRFLPGWRCRGRRGPEFFRIRLRGERRFWRKSYSGRRKRCGVFSKRDRKS